jgi:hypothetical protein
MRIPYLIAPGKASFLLLLAFGFLSITQAQTSPSKEDKKQAQQNLISDLVNSRNFDFIAESATPMSGRTRQLTGDYYDLKITDSAIVSFLPYYGRAYQAPIDPTKGGIQFISKKFDYTMTPRNKGGWDILVKPTDTQDVQQLSINISVDGYATLQVTSLNRQPISFYGTIVKLKQKHD